MRVDPGTFIADKAYDADPSSKNSKSGGSHRLSPKEKPYLSTKNPFFNL
ncbi:hypothetical protein MSKU9_0615 [Komagataeibacter diospyri]|uniref:Uncharacterized protein n=1 Tax=Komagataeibacter diospyri TaxID=1932662 RepID=A0A4P5NQS4_9PROT|nr:hypothetical protein MSKU9_0615 [Komagataeibacter diospyri]